MSRNNCVDDVLVFTKLGSCLSSCVLAIHFPFSSLLIICKIVLIGEILACSDSLVKSLNFLSVNVPSLNAMYIVDCKTG